MKLLKDNWKIIVILILLVGLGFSIKIGLDVRKDRNRLEDNQVQFLSDLHSKVLELTSKEFKRSAALQNSLLKELADSVKAKPRRFERVIYNNYTHSFDTTITMIKESGPGKEVDSVRTFRLEKDCVKILASINWNANTARLDTVGIDYHSVTLHYWDRKRKLWFLRFGRKQYFAVTKNTCTGQTETIDIQFKKRRK